MNEVSVAVTGADEPARVDLCDRCGGAFLEFFDGEPGELSRGVLEQHLDGRRHEAPPSMPACNCPDCATALTPDRYRDGPPVWRCGSCQAIFAGRAELEALAVFRLPDEPAGAHSQLSLLARLRRLFFNDR
jgi:hypothetical protein